MTTKPTLVDIEHTRPDPVPLLDECAAEIHSRRYAWDFDTCGSRYREARRADAVAVIDVLRSRGFITIDGLQAIKAERIGTEEQGERK